MPLILIKNKNAVEFDTRERCSITEILNDAQSPHLSIARCTVKLGITTELHSLAGMKEVYFIEKGSGMMDDGVCEPFSVKPGDCITISPDHPQRIRNIGKVDLVFKVVCTPRFNPECYTPLEGTDI
jgi:mannose-6-phosphate isomerase-like protein (cupin superfamily)